MLMLRRRLRLIEVPKTLLADLTDIIGQLPDDDHALCCYCDDLSFEADDAGYKSLKVVLDGSISPIPTIF
jgi:uncharacterized protein